MKCFFIAALLFIIQTTIFAQPSDFITVKKKNGRIIASYAPGSTITFQTFYNRYVSGPVIKIIHDSIYVKTFDIRTFMTSLGVTRADTFNTFITPYHYKDIKSVELFNYRGAKRLNVDKLLLIGAGGYIILNTINSLYLKQSLTDSKNLVKLSIAGSVLIIGYALNKLFYKNPHNKIEYVNMRS